MVELVLTMTSTPDLKPLSGCDDPASVLGYARGRNRDGDQADRDVMVAAAKWASMHTEDSLVGPVETWHESCLPLGGTGCPGIAEFAVTEFAAALGTTPESGRRYLAQAVEAFYRLPDCWKKLQAGRLQAWRLGMVADATLCLSREAAGFVDTHVAPVAHKIGPAQLMRLVEEAMARFDPDQTEAERAAAADARHFDVELAQVSSAGTVHLEGDLDLADAYDLNTAVSAGAKELLALGSTESLNVRRSIAVGDLARAQLALGFPTTDAAADGTPKPRVPGRQIVLHTHISADAVTGATGTGGAADLARVHEVLQAITTEQVRQWCGNPDTTVTVKPVLDLAEHIWVMSYEASDRLKAPDRPAGRDLCPPLLHPTRGQVRLRTPGPL